MINWKRVLITLFTIITGVLTCSISSGFGISVTTGYDLFWFGIMLLLFCLGVGFLTSEWYEQFK